MRDAMPRSAPLSTDANSGGVGDGGLKLAGSEVVEEALSSRLPILATGAFLAAVWAITVWHLSAEWTINTQYQYGWVVPFLALYLTWLCVERCPVVSRPFPVTVSRVGTLGASIAVGIAFLLREANPEWRLLGWIFSGTAIALTFVLIGRVGGWRWVRHFAFPILFFLTAVPLPREQESAVMMGLMQKNAAIVAEALRWFGHDAVAKGNLVQLPTGDIGVNEACSGVRSLQGAVMMSLFVGELFRLTGIARMLLVISGMAWALAANGCRTTWLGLIAANEGSAAMERWHDIAGYTVLGVGFVVLLAVAAGLQRLSKLPPPGVPARAAPSPRPAAPFANLRSLGFASGISLGLLLLSIVGTHGWFLWKERHVIPGVVWRAVLPRDNPSYQEIKLSVPVREELRYDHGESGKWTDSGGLRWQAAYFTWQPGWNGEQTVLVHDPRVCMQAAGARFVETLPDVRMDRENSTLRFECHHFEDSGRHVFVFNAVTSDVIRPGADMSAHALSRFRRLQAVADGVRHLGQRRLEVAIWGPTSGLEAERAFRDFLETNIIIDPSSPAKGARL